MVLGQKVFPNSTHFDKKTELSDFSTCTTEATPSNMFSFTTGLPVSSYEKN